MTRAAPQQVTFGAGEVSSLLYGRPDYIRYRAGLKRCRGFLPLPEGVATRMPGTRYMGAAAALDVRLISFVFRDDDSHVLEFTPLKMRVWRNGALVMDGSDPYELTTPYPAASLPLLQSVQNGDRIYLVDGLRAPQRLSRAAADSWTIEPTPFVDGPFGAENDDESVTVQASAASGAITLTGVNGPFAGMEAGGHLRIDAIDQDDVPTWTGNTAASVGDKFANDGRVYEIVSFDASGTTTGVNPPTHTEGDVLSSKGGPVWRALHAGWGVVKLTSVTNANAAAGTVTGTLPDDVVNNASWRWSPPAWSAARGWPRAVGSHQQRVIYGGSSTEPRSVWLSEIGSFTRFGRGVDADDAFGYTLAPGRNRLNEIRWIEDGASGAHIATSGEIVTARPTDQGVAIGPTTTDFRRGNRAGAARIAPEIVDGEPVYVAATGRKLRALAYELENDRVRAEEISENSRHIMVGGAVALAWQEEPWRILWIALADGDLAGMTYYPAQQVYAMHRHNLCDGLVKSIAVVPTDDGASEDLWLAVRRTVDNVAAVYIERLAAVHFETELDAPDPLDAWHQCAAIAWSGDAATTVAGLDHLEGETVVAWTDQGAQSGVVTDGTLTLAEPVTRAIVGLDPSSAQQLRSLPLTPQTREGGGDGQPRRNRAMGVRLLHSAGGTLRAVAVSQTGDAPGPALRLERAGADPFAPVRQFTGVVELLPAGGWGDDQELLVQPAPGAPLTLAGYTVTLMTGEG